MPTISQVSRLMSSSGSVRMTSATSSGPSAISKAAARRRPLAEARSPLVRVAG